MCDAWATRCWRGVNLSGADGRWEAKLVFGYENGRRRRKSLYGATRAEVARKRNAALRAQQQGLPGQNDRITVGAYLDQWLTAAEHRVRPRTLRWYEEIVRLHLAPSLGRVQLTRRTPAHVTQALNQAVARGRSPQSVNHDRIGSVRR